MNKILCLILLFFVILFGCVTDNLAPYRTEAGAKVSRVISSIADLENDGHIDHVINNINSLLDFYDKFIARHQMECCIRRLAKETWASVETNLKTGSDSDKELYHAYQRNKYRAEPLDSWLTLQVVEGRKTSGG